MSATTPTISLVQQDGAEAQSWAELYDPAVAGGIRVDSPAWFTWLGAPTTRSFAYPVYDHRQGYIAGFMTVRLERRQRGGGYWVAYRRCGGQLRKAYLGASARLTKHCLDTLAQAFLAADQRCRSAAGAADDSD